ncbi:MAG: SpoIIE family protein phosphatase [Calditrichia bacterium]
MKLKKIFFCFLPVIFPLLLNAADITILDSTICEKYVWLKTNWVYHSGDHPSWADPSFPDTLWRETETLLEKEQLEKVYWSGIAWFRLHFKLDSTVNDSLFGIRLFQTGASEVYLNGKLVKQIGSIGSTREEFKTSIGRSPFPILLHQQKGEQVLAVRYANDATDDIIASGWPAGFRLYLGNYQKLLEENRRFTEKNSLYLTAFLVICLMLLFVHLAIYIYDSQLKYHFYYVIFLLCFSFYVFIIHYYPLSDNIQLSLFFYRWGILALNMTIFFGVVTIYSIYSRLPGYFLWLFAAGFLLGGIGIIYFPHPYLWYADYAYISFVSALAGNVLFSPRYARFKERPIIQTGFIIMSAAGIYQMAIALEILPVIFGLDRIYIFGVLAFIISMSLALAKNFAENRRRLQIQLEEVKRLNEVALEQERKAHRLEVQQKELETDNAHKTQELEDARRLQLSMLPKDVPDIPGFDIAVFMSTATEVGGDYYDFAEQDNRLYITVGDATGHGMKAGTMVASVKSLFNALGMNRDPRDFLRTCSRILHRMNMGNLYMGMQILVVEGSSIQLTSAGMPAMLLWRKENSQVEEWVLKGIPLGTHFDYPYETRQGILNPGDSLLLMSDGFPELFNSKREILEMERVKNILQNIGYLPSAEMINRLKKAAEDWRQGFPQRDDMTFVVIKKKA